jgi:predicted aminopeptidase
VYDGWMSRPLNNARLTSIDTYYQWVPMFEALQQQFNGDWEGFFNAVKQLDNDPPSEDS